MLYDIKLKFYYSPRSERADRQMDRNEEKIDKICSKYSVSGYGSIYEGDYTFTNVPKEHLDDITTAFSNVNPVVSEVPYETLGMRLETKSDVLSRQIKKWRKHYSETNRQLESAKCFLYGYNENQSYVINDKAFEVKLQTPIKLEEYSNKHVMKIDVIKREKGGSIQLKKVGEDYFNIMMLEQSSYRLVFETLCAELKKQNDAKREA
ncbi:hypothetical protein [Aureispira sp. CCB-E]|uniref:hypothetical protein n=1 Tax=Aureispira sp. CCB-E TaxID=3051121 RepID=UPI002868A0CB|nr:hypothetical protein [Aureispira sp. CCB-E]WMX12385.1 hypothetical protein QP953_16265 [Aureispira sp. CCB-E]